MILVVDDSRIQWEMLARRLEEEGFETCIAEDGVEALERLLTNDSISLLITDIEMPRMDGMKLMQTIRKDAALSSLPIIAVSAYRTIRDNGAILDAGADYFVTKPLNYNALLEYVKRYIAPAFV